MMRVPAPISVSIRCVFGLLRLNIAGPSTLGLNLPRIGFSHRGQARRAHLDVDGARLEACGQYDLLLEILEIAELKRQRAHRARGVAAQLRERQLDRAAARACLRSEC